MCSQSPRRSQGGLCQRNVGRCRGSVSLMVGLPDPCRSPVGCCRRRGRSYIPGASRGDRGVPHGSACAPSALRNQQHSPSTPCDRQGPNGRRSLDLARDPKRRCCAKAQRQPALAPTARASGARAKTGGEHRPRSSWPAEEINRATPIIVPGTMTPLEIVAWHEAAHAVADHRLGLGVLEVRVSGAEGRCEPVARDYRAELPEQPTEGDVVNTWAPWGIGRTRRPRRRGSHPRRRPAPCLRPIRRGPSRSLAATGYTPRQLRVGPGLARLPRRRARRRGMASHRTGSAGASSASHAQRRGGGRAGRLGGGSQLHDRHCLMGTERDPIIQQLVDRLSSGHGSGSQPRASRPFAAPRTMPSSIRSV